MMMTEYRPYQVYVCNDDPDGRIYHISLVSPDRPSRIIARFRERLPATILAHRKNQVYRTMLNFRNRKR